LLETISLMTSALLSTVFFCVHAKSSGSIAAAMSASDIFFVKDVFFNPDIFLKASNADFPKNHHVAIIIS